MPFKNMGWVAEKGCFINGNFIQFIINNSPIESTSYEVRLVVFFTELLLERLSSLERERIHFACCPISRVARDAQGRSLRFGVYRKLQR